MIRILLILAFAITALTAGGHLPVSGEAVVLVVPDQAVITFGIETRHSQLSTSKEQNDAIAAKVNAAITALGVKPDQVRVDCLEIAPFYPSDSTLIPAHFRIVRNMVVTLLDTKQVDALLTGVVMAGVTQVHHVEFRTTELRKYRDEARKMAIRAAHDKATVLTGELGQHIGKAIATSEGQIGWYGYNSYRSRDSRVQYQNSVGNAGGDGDGDTLVPLGQIAVRATVSVTFEIE